MMHTQTGTYMGGEKTLKMGHFLGSDPLALTRSLDCLGSVLLARLGSLGSARLLGLGSEVVVSLSRASWHEGYFK